MDWQRAYEMGQTPWEKGEAHPAMAHLSQLGWFRDWSGRRVLCPGAGLGHDVAYLAKEGVDALGIDISPLAVEMSGAANVIVGDLFAAGEWAECCGVWEHTCYCAIDPSQRAQYRRSVAEIMAAGEWLCGIFFLNPDHDEPGPPFGVDREELLADFEADFDIVESLVPPVTYEGREGRELAVRMRRKV